MAVEHKHTTLTQRHNDFCIFGRISEVAEADGCEGQGAAVTAMWKGFRSWPVFVFTTPQGENVLDFWIFLLLLFLLIASVLYFSQDNKIGEQMQRPRNPVSSPCCIILQLCHLPLKNEKCSSILGLLGQPESPPWSRHAVCVCVGTAVFWCEDLVSVWEPGSKEKRSVPLT